MFSLVSVCWHGEGAATWPVLDLIIQASSSSNLVAMTKDAVPTCSFWLISTAGLGFRFGFGLGFQILCLHSIIYNTFPLHWLGVGSLLPMRITYCCIGQQSESESESGSGNKPFEDSPLPQVLTAEARTVGKQAVHILLECFLVQTFEYNFTIHWLHWNILFLIIVTNDLWFIC